MLNAAKNITAGILVGYGFTALVYFGIMTQLWVDAAPHQPNKDLGLTYRHNEHGAYTYLSQFQTTSCWLMFTTSIPMTFLGVLIAPKRKISGNVRWYGARFNWEQDDPMRLMRRSALASTIATPFFLYFIGPSIIRWLNSTGFVMNL